jgi:Kip1 ubiquitination-promoting complex protein 1
MQPQRLQDVITFLVLHFHDSRIINPDVRDELLQAIYKLLQSADWVSVFEQNGAAREKLMVSLLAAFDARTWVSISGIILRLVKGGGFGQLPATAIEGSSLLFRSLLRDACVQHGPIFDAFLNRLFNTLNWTVTEFVVVLKEVHDAVTAQRAADANAQRRCGLMFELSVNLERLLEFLASQLPAAFRGGSTLNLTRLVELLSFILSHTTGKGAQLLDSTTAMNLASLAKVNRQALLAPLVGTLARLFDVERQAGEGSGHSVSEAMAAAETCPMGALEHTAGLDWTPQKPGNEAAYADAVVFQEFVTVVKALRDEEAARAGSDADGANEVPDEFLDPLLSTIMTDPVLLPDSNITVDRATIERHLMSSKTDPFNRSPLTLDAVKPNTALKGKIDEWKAARRR